MNRGKTPKTAYGCLLLIGVGFLTFLLGVTTITTYYRYDALAIELEAWHFYLLGFTGVVTAWCLNDFLREAYDFAQSLEGDGE